MRPKMIVSIGATGALLVAGGVAWASEAAGGTTPHSTKQHACTGVYARIAPVGVLTDRSGNYVCGFDRSPAIPAASGLGPQ